MRKTKQTLAAARAWRWPKPLKPELFQKMSTRDAATAMGVTPTAVWHWVELGCPQARDGSMCLADVVRWHEKQAVNLAVKTVATAFMESH